MQKKIVKNNEGETLKTKEGKELVEFRLEEGDQIVPTYNSVLENTHESMIKGSKTTITKYTIKCKARDKDNELIEKGEEIFLTLTPTQAETLKNKADNGIELNQTLFKAYKYVSQKYGDQIGIGQNKPQKKPKTFEELDKENKEE